MKYDWVKGEPPHPWNKEWFFAKLKNGTYAVLYPLPEEYSHQYKTADETYYKKDWVAAWMQRPASEYVDFVPAPGNAQQQVQADSSGTPNSLT